MLTFLKKIGIQIARGAGIVTGILPMIAPQLQQVRDLGGRPASVIDRFETALKMIFMVEGMFLAAGIEKGGAQKAKASGPYIAQLILSTDALDGKKLDSDKEQAFRDACERAAGALADALNCFKPDGD